MGCGPGIYVPRQAVEAQVLQGLNALLSHCGDPKGFTHQVNEELRQLWKKSTGYAEAGDARRRIATIDEKIANVRCAIENGYNDVERANQQLRDLTSERDLL